MVEPLSCSLSSRLRTLGSILRALDEMFLLLLIIKDDGQNGILKSRMGR